MTAPQGRRSSRVEYTIYSPLTLESLRWLVYQCDGLPDNSIVYVQEYKEHGPTDYDEAFIKVSGEMPRKGV